MARVVVEKEGNRYELKKAEDNMHQCKACAFCQLCLNIDDGISEYPCDDFGKGNYYFITI